MGFVGTLLEIIGFCFGVPIGLLAGYFFFIFYSRKNFKDLKHGKRQSNSSQHLLFLEQEDDDPP